MSKIFNKRKDPLLDFTLTSFISITEQSRAEILDQLDEDLMSYHSFFSEEEYNKLSMLISMVVELGELAQLTHCKALYKKPEKPFTQILKKLQSIIRTRMKAFDNFPESTIECMLRQEANPIRLRSPTGQIPEVDYSRYFEKIEQFGKEEKKLHLKATTGIRCDAIMINNIVVSESVQVSLNVKIQVRFTPNLKQKTMKKNYRLSSTIVITKLIEGGEKCQK